MEHIDHGRPTPRPAMPPRPIDELANPQTSIYRLRQLATARGYSIAGLHSDPLDYLELTAEVA